MLSQILGISRIDFLFSTTPNNQNNMFNSSPCIFIVDAGSLEDTYLLTFPMADCRGAGDQKKPKQTKTKPILHYCAGLLELFQSFTYMKDFKMMNQRILGEGAVEWNFPIPSFLPRSLATLPFI